MVGALLAMIPSTAILLLSASLLLSPKHAEFAKAAAPVPSYVTSRLSWDYPPDLSSRVLFDVWGNSNVVLAKTTRLITGLNGTNRSATVIVTNQSKFFFSVSSRWK